MKHAYPPLSDLRPKLNVPLLLVALAAGTQAAGQNFTRVQSATNPVTTDQFESGGASWVDVNGDGYLDLFVAHGNLSDQDNALYLNQSGTGFLKVTTGAIVNDGGSSIGSTWADFDHDGDLDCMVTNRANFGNFLYLGHGDTTFTAVTSGGVVDDIAHSNMSSWVDLDNDGDLDLYVINFQGADFMYLNSGAPDFLLTSTTNTINTDALSSIPGLWGDYNNDLRPDLFIGIGAGQNDQLYTNNGGLSFTMTTIADGRFTLGASWADFDNDGDLDLFAANYLNGGNLYYVNSGAPAYTLTEVSTGALADTGNCVGSAWGDVDNDGDLDLFVGNDGGNNFLYLNNGPPAYDFTPVVAGSVVTDGGQTFGCVFGDYDNDGQLDLFVANRLNEVDFLYHNDGNANHWVTITCEGVASNHSAIGATVLVKADINGSPITQMQQVSSNSGYNAQNLWLHFGLGDAAVIDTLIVRWPSGAVDTCLNVVPDQRITMVEGNCGSVQGIDAVAGGGPIFSVSPNPAHHEVVVRTQGASAQTTWSLADATGRVVAAGIITAPEVRIPVGRLRDGVYALTLRTGDRSHTGRFVKE